MNTRTGLTTGCPYASGTDHLKMHWLFTGKKEAMEMDKQIEARRDPACGKPVHPGSCMCQEHLRFGRGYTRHPRLEYPHKGAAFTCMHSPSDFGSDKRWIIHDVNGHFCAELSTEEEAKSLTDKWVAAGADDITIDWISSGEDAADSDRGTYFIGMKDVKRRIPVRAGWHSMEAAAEKARQLRDMLIMMGRDRVTAHLNENGH